MMGYKMADREIMVGVVGNEDNASGAGFHSQVDMEKHLEGESDGVE